MTTKDITLKHSITKTLHDHSIHTTEIAITNQAVRSDQQKQVIKNTKELIQEALNLPMTEELDIPEEFQIPESEIYTIHNSNIANNPEYTSRMNRVFQEDFEIERSEDNIFIVKANSNKWFTVYRQNNKYHCDCEDFKNRMPSIGCCKHAIAVHISYNAIESGKELPHTIIYRDIRN